MVHHSTKKIISNPTTFAQVWSVLQIVFHWVRVSLAVTIASFSLLLIQRAILLLILSAEFLGLP
jgi:hypothetical protein